MNQVIPKQRAKKMNKRATSLVEVLIALSIGIGILIPSVALFSTSSKVVEKGRNLSFASSLSRYIIQNMMTMKMDKIVSVPIPGLSVCDDSNENYYFGELFNFKSDNGKFKKGNIGINKDQLPELYNYLARYDFRYSIAVGEANPSDDISDIIKSVTVLITWKEFGVDKVYESHAYIIPR